MILVVSGPDEEYGRINMYETDVENTYSRDAQGI